MIVFASWLQRNREVIFALPVIWGAKEEDGSWLHRADFAAHFFKALFKIGAVASRQNDGKVEVEFRLPFDEFIEAVGHFGFDEGFCFCSWMLRLLLLRKSTMLAQERMPTLLATRFPTSMRPGPPPVTRAMGVSGLRRDG